MKTDTLRLKRIVENFDFEYCDDEDFFKRLGHVYEMSLEQFESFQHERELTDFGKMWSEIRAFFLELARAYQDTRDFRAIENLQETLLLTEELPMTRLIEERLLFAEKKGTIESLESVLFLINFLPDDNIGLSYANILHGLRCCFKQQNISPTAILNKDPFFLTPLGREVLEDVIKKM